MSARPNGDAGFRRELRSFDATMVVVGSMIGSGVFIVSADIARTVGAAGWLLVAWLIAGLFTLVGAACYGELAGMMPAAGGQYVYLREAYNPLIGFLYGWTLFLVIQTGTIAAVAVAFAKFTGVLIPWFGPDNVLCSLAGVDVSAAQLLAIASIGALTLVNGFGVKHGRRVQNVFTVCKTLALVAVIGIGLLGGLRGSAAQANFSQAWDASRTLRGPGGAVSIEALTGLAAAAALGAAMVGSLFAADAWNNITFAAGEVVAPRRTIPRSLVVGVGLVSLLYFLTNLSYLTALPLQGDPQAIDAVGRGIQFAADDRVATAAVSVVFGQRAAALMAALILVSTFGCNNGLILAGARVYYAMARDGLFFRQAGRLNRFAVPGVALAVQGVWASLLCLSGTYSQLLDYVVFAVLLFYALTVAGMCALRRRRPDAERPFRALGHPILPLLYIAVATAIAIDLLIIKPAYTLPGLLIVLLGAPVYVLWRRAGAAPHSPLTRRAR